MDLRVRLREALLNLSVEFLALWFVFRDRRVRWHTKILLVLPIAYVVSPIDLLSDSILFWGQIDDIVVLRISYVLLTKFLDPAVLNDSRERSSLFLQAGGSNRLKFAGAVLLVWGFVLFLIGESIFKRFLKHH